MDKEVVSNLVTLLAVCLGWVLGVITSLIKSFFNKRKLKAAIELELQDGAAWVGRNLLTLEHMIALTTIRVLPNFGVVPVPTHLFDKYYVDVSIDFTSSQRISLNSIHNLLSISQQQSDALQEIRQKCILDMKHFKEYRDLLTGIYHNTAMIQAQINYHISQGEKLDVYSLKADDATRIYDQVSDRIGEIITDAKKLDKKSIDQKYFRD